MSNIDKLRKINRNIYSSKINTSNSYNLIADEVHRVSEISKNIVENFEKINSDFKQATKLDGKDIAFLFLATGLQCARQYLLTNFKSKEERPDDQTAAKDTLFHKEEHSDRSHRLYNPSLEEIDTNPVPFDTVFGAKSIGSEVAKHGGHRYTTLGHDPILGWIFGTANIATSTITEYTLQSYHVHTGFTKAGAARDMLTKHADTGLVFSHLFSKMFKEGKEGKEKVAHSLFKEAVHLTSDVKTKDSLPIPAISLASPELASKLADYGIDTANLLTVGKQATMAALINTLISWIHFLMYDSSKDGSRSLYEVRTRKILSYSNAIATSSNVLGVAIATSVNAVSGNENGLKKSLSYLDIGGFIVTLHRLISDHKFITQIKQEFIEKEMYKLFFDESLI